jgi:hypothetical protein
MRFARSGAPPRAKRADGAIGGSQREQQGLCQGEKRVESRNAVTAHAKPASGCSTGAGFGEDSFVVQLAHNMRRLLWGRLNVGDGTATEKTGRREPGTQSCATECGLGRTSLRHPAPDQVGEMLSIASVASKGCGTASTAASLRHYTTIRRYG